MRNLKVKFYIGLVFALLCICHASGQEILQKKKTEIRGKGIPIEYSNLFHLFGKTYYSTGWGGNDQVYYGGKLFAGAISDTLIDHTRRDQFIFELDTNLEVKSTYVIDNCEEYSDHTNTDDFGVMLINFESNEDADSLAIMTLPEGTQIKRSDYLGQSVLIVTDSNFNYIEHLVPTTGKILMIEGGSEHLYMTIRIPNGTPYILVGQDTFFNKEDFLISYPSSLILASYNLTTGTFNWANWLGSTHLDYIYDFKIDTDENLILLVSPYTTFELANEDTINIGLGPYYNIILKFDNNGNYQWGENFEESYTEYFYSLDIDDDGSIYLLGSIKFNEILLDTILNVGNWSNTPDHGILLKLKPTGEFDWAYQVEGEYRLNTFHKLVIKSATHELFLSGHHDLGSFVLNGINFSTSPDYSSAYILRINSDEGNLEDHVISQEGLPVFFPHMTIDEIGNLIAYIALNDRILFLDIELSPFEARSAGYLLRLSSEWKSLVKTHEVAIGLFKLYPNPVVIGQSIQIELDQKYLVKNTHAVIVDMQGFVVKAVLVQDQMTSISTSGLVPGMYTLCVYNNQYYQSEMIVIQ